MAVTLIIEDGSGKSDANSFASIAEARAYAQNRGVVLSIDDDVVGAQLVSAGDWLNARDCDFKGEKAHDTQSMVYPRKGVYIGGKLQPSDAIPQALKAAQFQLVIAQHNGANLFGVISPADLVVEETVGPLTTKYADPVKLIESGAYGTTFEAVEALLKPLMGGCGQSCGGGWWSTQKAF